VWTEIKSSVWKPEGKSVLDRPWSRYVSVKKEFVKRHLTSAHLTMWDGLNFLILLCIIINRTASSARTVSIIGTLLYIKQATSSGTYRLVRYSRARHLPSQHIALANCEAECVMYDCITKETTPLYLYIDPERLYRAAVAASGGRIWSKRKPAS
jgi:hypothetical protein